MAEKDLKRFLKTSRKNISYRPVCERIKDYQEVAPVPAPEHSQDQAHRCMDCGTAFCNWACPIGNYIPEFNDALVDGKLVRAVKLLEATNNLAEITGRVCPALCEYSCVLGINDDPVTIRENELSIVEQGFENDLIKPQPPKVRTGKKVAVVGSGPAGLAAAAQLNKAGHRVTVFEKDKKPGGILRYGIPDFKLDKKVIDRRIKLLKEEGIEFRINVNVGKDLPVSELKDYNAIILAIGSRVPRDLKIEGRNLEGIYFAMDYLTQSNKRVAKELFNDELIDAKGKKVVVIGGGDTGSDCLGTAHRQGASCVVQVEVMPKPPLCRSDECSWPKYPLLLKTSSSHQEGGQRYWSVLTKEFLGNEGGVKKISCVEIEFSKDKKGCPLIKEIPGSEFEIEADMVILAIGFLHPQHRGLVESLGLEFDSRGNIKTNNNYMASQQGVFCAGDAHRGQSLVVWAISEGRRCAHKVDTYLMGKTSLPSL